MSASCINPTAATNPGTAFVFQIWSVTRMEVQVAAPSGGLSWLFTSCVELWAPSRDACLSPRVQGAAVGTLGTWYGIKEQL